MESVAIDITMGRAKRLLSPLENRLLRIAAENYKYRYADIDPTGSALVSTELCAVELDSLLETLRELPPVLKVQLTSVFSEMEDLIFDDSAIASFDPGERKDAYVFLLHISGTTIPD